MTAREVSRLADELGADVADNAEPSPPDPKDIPFVGNTARGLPAAVLGPSFRHTGRNWPVLDQGTTGTCGGQAGTGLRQWQELQDTNDLQKSSAPSRSTTSA